ncbi:MAG TPA: S8 family serine peptidase [Actinomycetota bacterium]|nr:S8 family serine peptidase [Actinomycetota bacterium]
MRLLLLLAVVLSTVFPPTAAAEAAPRARLIAESFLGPGVIAHIDTGINPYNVAFRDKSPLARKHPSTYIEGYPKDALPLRLSLGLPYEEAIERDQAVWAQVRPRQLYWIPGTRIVGAISFGSGGTCSREAPPPANGGGGCTEHVILDDHGHGTMTASRMAAEGKFASLAPTARIVSIEGLGAGSVTWAADQGWIDVQTNSWISLLPPPLSGRVVDETSNAFRAAAEKMFTVAASGNGAAYILGLVPTPTYLLSTAPPGVVIVGGHDNGRLTLWAGSPPHVVADAYGGVTALRDSSTDIEGHPIACCTSAAAPYAAGGAMAIVQRARALLRSDQVGIIDGVVAAGKSDIKEGPLADGEFTLEELQTVYFRTAEALPDEGAADGVLHWAGEPRAPDYTAYGPGANPFCLLCTTTAVTWADLPSGLDPYPFVGYGAINERSLELAFAVLTGETALPERAASDAQYEADQALRAAIFP